MHAYPKANNGCLLGGQLTVELQWQLSVQCLVSAWPEPCMGRIAELCIPMMLLGDLFDQGFCSCMCGVLLNLCTDS